ncbi:MULTISPECIES: LysR substrate-binding domain-containing protein [unclassified Halomonas]|uniref:LysR substrate-binding domain-containing protein n=1 Tax=unclassified Halomonas TaxID=2609666 RepID=UPI001C98AF6C|nr:MULTISPECIES: LysR substrate-binding domain-containing protein [unclassified Halomonas]MBY5923874.1 LysR family transcriptional regulator [Halomonas sp. DP4Y7-2]MBY6230916.1 LysR family transcriptional regulator [Halomonas sp. DP4Y7-1]
MSALPPLHWLQAFEASARTLSFTAAGQELSVTQAAISQRIRLLEDRLGQALFVRHPRSLSLTPAGQAWLPSVQEAFARLEEGTLEVFGTTSEGQVTLRTTPALQHYWLAPRLARFHATHRDISVRVVSAIWSADFGAQGADMEIRYGRGDWGNVESISLGKESLIPVCSPSLAERLASPGDLAGQTLLHAAGFASGWLAWLSLVDQAALSRQCHSLVCDNLSMVISLAEQGVGVALVHQRLLSGRHSLVAPFATALPVDEGFWLCRPKRQQGQAAHGLWTWLLAYREDAERSVITPAST